MDTKRPEIEDDKLSFLAMPLTKSLKLKKKRPPKVKMNEIFKTDKNTQLNPVCKVHTKEIKKYEVKLDPKQLNQFW
jgi:hypothetical protein